MNECLNLGGEGKACECLGKGPHSRAAGSKYRPKTVIPISFGKRPIATEAAGQAAQSAWPAVRPVAVVG